RSEPTEEHDRRHLRRARRGAVELQAREKVVPGRGEEGLPEEGLQVRGQQFNHRLDAAWNPLLDVLQAPGVEDTLLVVRALADRKRNRRRRIDADKAHWPRSARPHLFYDRRMRWSLDIGTAGRPGRSRHTPCVDIAGVGDVSSAKASSARPQMTIRSH